MAMKMAIKPTREPERYVFTRKPRLKGLALRVNSSIRQAGHMEQLTGPTGQKENHDETETLGTLLLLRTGSNDR
jgi:hypothetical protein